jgi:hypothetical protein
VPGNHGHFGEYIGESQHIGIAALQKGEDGEEPDELIGVGGVLEDLPEIKGLFRVA